MDIKQVDIGSRKINISYNEYSNIDRQIDEIISNQEYKRAKREIIVVDIGACIGMFSFFMYDWADKIFAVEPIDVNYSCLEKTIEDNKLEKIKLIKKGVAHINGVVKFSTPTNGMGFMVNPNHKMVKDIEVITLNELIKQYQIDYIDVLKVDAEGSEELIFTAPDIKEACQKIPFIIMENHGGDKIYKDCEALGYKISNREGQVLKRIIKHGIEIINPPFQGRYLILKK